MKNLLSRKLRIRGHAFTLVELLVVIGIIAILAAVTLQVGGAVINSAKRAKAANTATQIQTACLGYYTEYSIYPVPTGTTGDYVIGDSSSTDETSWGALIESLCGNLSPYKPGNAVSATVPNSRGIAFLTLKSSDVDAKDAPLNPLPSGSGASATNLYFSIAINSSYSGVLGTNAPSSTVMPSFGGTFATTGGTSTAGVAVWANCNAKTTVTNGNFFVHTY